MTNNIAKIRKAMNTGDANDLLTAMDALAELERAAKEPVAWMWNDELGIPHASAGSKKPVWLESSASAEYIKQANLRPLYAAPPAQVAEIREPTPAEESRMCEIYDARIKETAHGRAMFNAVAAYLRGELK